MFPPACLQIENGKLHRPGYIFWCVSATEGKISPICDTAQLRLSFFSSFTATTDNVIEVDELKDMLPLSRSSTSITNQRPRNYLMHTDTYTDTYTHTESTYRQALLWIVFSHEWSVNIYMSSVSHNTALGYPPFYWAPCMYFCSVVISLWRLGCTQCWFSYWD